MNENPGCRGCNNVERCVVIVDLRLSWEEDERPMRSAEHQKGLESRLELAPVGLSAGHFVGIHKSPWPTLFRHHVLMITLQLDTFCCDVIRAFSNSLSEAIRFLSFSLRREASKFFEVRKGEEAELHQPV